MLRVSVQELLEKLDADNQPGSWEVGYFYFVFWKLYSLYSKSIEATLHCIMSIQEAVPVEDNQYLKMVFGPQVLNRLPRTGRDRVRRTTLALIGTSHAQAMKVHVDSCSRFRRSICDMVHDPRPIGSSSWSSSLCSTGIR